MSERCECLDVFKRVEDKYVIAKEDVDKFVEACGNHIKEDIYFKYTVHSIYYDSPESDLVIHSLLKPKYKMKLRLRAYGDIHEDDTVFLETKKKYKDIVYKKRIPLKYKEAMDYLEYGKPHSVHNNTADEIDYILNFYNCESKTLILYDRTCYASTEEEDVRITFDENIRYRINDINLFENGDEIPLEKDLVLLEVKAMDRYPMWLVDILTDMNIQKISFSKYGSIYTNNFEEMKPSIAPSAYAYKGLKEKSLCSLQY